MPRKKTAIITKIEDKGGGTVIFENFQNSTVFNREVSPLNTEFLHRVISSPTYLFKHLDYSVVDDAGDVSYPLLTPLKRGNVSLNTGDGIPVSFILPNNNNDSRIFYLATTKGFVRAMKINGVARDLGRPITNPSIPYDTTIMLYSDKIFFINPSSNSIYHIPENTTETSWTEIGGLNSPYLGATFSTFLYFADRGSSGDNRKIVRVYNTSLTQSGTLDLGGNWDITDIINNNNRFLVLIASPKGVVSKQHAFLWDGSYQNRYFHSFLLPGQYYGSVNYLGAFILFIKVGASLNMYELSGFSLKPIDSIMSINIPTNLLPSYRFSVYGNYIAFPVSIKDLSINGVLLYNILEREMFFINSNFPSNPPYGCIFVGDLENKIYLFYTDGVQDLIKNSVFLPKGSLDDYINTSQQPFQDTVDETIYVSNKVNFIRAVKIDKIEVFYGKKPPANNHIKIEIVMKNNKLNISTTDVKTVDLNFLDNYAFIENVGAVGDEMVVKIKSKSDGTYRTTIKRFLVHYSYLL